MSDTEMIEKYSDLVNYIAIARTNQISDAEDVYQEVFLKYVDKKPKFKDETHAKAWFIRVTLNIVKNMYTSAEATRHIESEECDIDTLPSDRDFLREVEDEAVFAERLNQINPRSRIVMLLRFDCGYKIKEIAELAGESEEAVKAFFVNDEEFLTFVEEIKKRSFINTPIEINEDDDILLLSTASHEKNIGD